MSRLRFVWYGTVGMRTSIFPWRSDGMVLIGSGGLLLISIVNQKSRASEPTVGRNENVRKARS